MRLMAFDLESTGPDPKKDRIVEFCFITVTSELQEVSRFSGKVNPAYPVQVGAVQKHGLTNEALLGYPCFLEFAPKIQAMLEETILIAHSHTFDVPMLHYELVRNGQPGISAVHPCIDTMAIEGYVNSYRLDDVYKRYTGLELSGAHSACVDVEATLKVLHAQLTRFREKLPTAIEDLTYVKIKKLTGSSAKIWLDHSKNVYIIPVEEIPRFGFGKFQGEPVTEHLAYAKWVVRPGSKFPLDTQRVLKKILSESGRKSKVTTSSKR